MPVICKHNVPAVGTGLSNLQACCIYRLVAFTGLLHIEDMCTTEVPGYACYSALSTAVTW